MGSRTLGFGTGNLVFVPPEGRLRIRDLYHGRVVSIDLLRSRLEIRPAAFQELEVRAAEKVQSLGKATSQRSAECAEAVTRFVESVRTVAGTEERVPPPPQQVPPPMTTLWVRVTDQPAETFFEEDYDEAPEPDPTSAALPIYGTCLVAEADELEVPFPRVGAGAAFELFVPEAGGLLLEDLDPRQPLPIVHEFCGVEGVSSRGESVNLSVRGEVSGNAMGCAPLRRIGSSAFATLYFSQSFEVEHEVAGAFSGREFAALAAVLGRSHFRRLDSGKGWTILVRGDGDIVHFYHGLEGKESAGAATVPPLVFVAQAGGSLEPAARAALLTQFRELLRSALESPKP